MNRKEAIERIQELVATEEINKCLEILKQPITLADFLGWEEDVEYNAFDERYKVVNNELYWFNDRYNEWIKSDYDEELINFQQAKKIQPKKYYLKLKGSYREFYGIKNNSIYLNFDKTNGRLFLSNSNNYEACRTQFTKEESEEMKKQDYINFEQFELIEVGEDD